MIARALRDAGMEVVYTGLFQSPEQIVETAIQEDVDVIGLSILSGAHDVLVPKVIELLKKRKVRDVMLLVGGIIPREDERKLKKVGVAGVFGPGTSTRDIVKYIETNLPRS